MWRCNGNLHLRRLHAVISFIWLRYILFSDNQAASKFIHTLDKAYCYLLSEWFKTVAISLWGFHWTGVTIISPSSHVFFINNKAAFIILNTVLTALHTLIHVTIQIMAPKDSITRSTWNLTFQMIYVFSCCVWLSL